MIISNRGRQTNMLGFNYWILIYLYYWFFTWKNLFYTLNISKGTGINCISLLFAWYLSLFSSLMADHLTQLKIHPNLTIVSLFHYWICHHYLTLYIASKVFSPWRFVSLTYYIQTDWEASFGFSLKSTTDGCLLSFTGFSTMCC